MMTEQGFASIVSDHLPNAELRERQSPGPDVDGNWTTGHNHLQDN